MKEGINMKRKFAPVQMDYMKAKAMQETVTSIEKECKIKVLAANTFYNVPLEGQDIERILDPISDFEMSDTDFTTYCKLFKDECTLRGALTPDFDTTVDYQTRPALRKAEKELIHWGHDQIKQLPQYKGKNKKLLLDLFAKVDELRMSHYNELIDLTMHLQAV